MLASTRNSLDQVLAEKCAVGLLICIIAAVYWQTAGFDFINYDDQDYVVNNAMVNSGLTLQGVVWAFSSFDHANWHPLTWLSHMLAIEFFGLNPSGHHLANVVLHLANTLLLFFLLRQATGCRWRSLFTAALFGLHPLHVESVAWVVERKDLLSTLFMLLTMQAYGRYATSRTAAAYCAALLFFALGLMAKPMLVTLPFVLMLWDIWPLQRWQSGNRMKDFFFKLVPEKTPFFLLTIASCIVTYLAQHQGGAVAISDAVPLSFRAMNAALSYWRYIGGMLWPANLAVIYPLPENISLIRGILAGTALLAVTAVSIRLGRENPFLPVGWLWFLGTLVPVIGLVQVGQQAMADRYTYIPLIGLFIVISWGIPRLAQGSKLPRSVVPAAALAVLAALTACTWFQTGYWKNSVTLFTHAGRAVAGNHIAHRILGNALAQQERYDEAGHAFQEALRIRPDDAQTHVDLGLMSARRGNTARALQHYRDALRIDPKSPFAHNNLGSLLADQGNFTEAIGHFHAVLEINPEWSDVHRNIGQSYAESGDFPNALLHFDKALRKDPYNAILHYNRGMALAMQGRLEESIAGFRKAVKLQPAYAEAHYNLGIALVKSGRGEEAARHFAEAVRMNPKLEEAIKAMGAPLTGNPP